MMRKEWVHQRFNPSPAIFLVLAAIGLTFLAAHSPVERNQEARVLETAREMLHGPARQWIVPRINDEIRVQKPPLTYWMSAVSMKLMGEGKFAGRLPFVLAMLATLWVIYRYGAKCFSPATGQFAIWMTLGTTLYASYGFLAETDAITVLFVMLGVMGINRCADSEKLRDRVIGSAMAGLFAGLAAMSKGPPALFVPGYALVLALFERNRRILFDFLALGGLVLMALIGAPWWLMVARNPQYSEILAHEVAAIGAGADHGRPFWYALIFTMLACLPFIGPALGTLWGVLWGGMPWEKPVRRCVLWLLTTFLSLMAMAQKQDHYYFQVVPPIMLIAARYIELGLDDETRKGKIHVVATGSLAITAIIGAAASPAFIIIGLRSSRGLAAPDIVMSSTCAFLFGWAALRFFRNNTKPMGAVLMMMGFSAIGIQTIVHLWAPTLRTSFRAIADDMRKNRLDQSVVFYPMVNYRMNFELGKVIPVVEDPLALRQILSDNPGMSVIIEMDAKKIQIPDFIETRLEYPKRGKGLIVGVLKKE